MEISILLFQKIISMALMIIMGYIPVKVKLLKSEQSVVISIVNLYVIYPCMVLYAFQIEYSTKRLMGLGIAFVAAIVLHALYIAITRLLGDVLKMDGVERASLIYSNGGNLIIPIVMSILGTEYVFYSCAFVAVQSILNWVHNVRLLNPKAGLEWKKVILNPNILVIVIGIVCFLGRITFPDVLTDTISSVGNMIGPTAMIMIGMLMADINFKEVFCNLRYYMVSFGRLILYPLLFIAVIKISQITTRLPESKNILVVTILAASAPVAVSVTQMANVVGADAKKAGAINVMSIIFCILTLPLMVALYQIWC